MGNTVAILTPQFFSFDGSSCMVGGAERYAIDLISFMRSNGLEAEIFQLAINDFEREYKGIRVHGVKSNMMISVHFPRAAIEPVIERTINYDHIVYFNMQMCPVGDRKDGIVISHGVYWDRPTHPHHYDIALRQINSAIQGNFLVSVDANTLNVLQSFIRGFDRSRTEIIPNYADKSVFSPRISSDREDHEYYTVLYPRSFTYARGFHLAVVAAEELLRKHRIRFVFAGYGEAEQIKTIDMLQLKFGTKKVERRVYDTDKAHLMYRDADIVIIPTMHCEGTSLSAIEAMSCGLPIVSTRVGGLSELIFDGFNAYEIRPDAHELAGAIEHAFENQTYAGVLGYNGHAFSGHLNKGAWESKWAQVLDKMRWV